MELALYQDFCFYDDGGDPMNHKKKIIESYILLFIDLLSVTVSYLIAIILRYQKIKFKDRRKFNEYSTD